MCCFLARRISVGSRFGDGLFSFCREGRGTTVSFSSDVDECFFCGQGRIVSTRSFPKRSRRGWILTPTSGGSVHTCCIAS